MFIGIDHGTTAMRFSTRGPVGVQRSPVKRPELLGRPTFGRPSAPLDEIRGGIAVCYSMGWTVSLLSPISGRSRIRGRHLTGGGAASISAAAPGSMTRVERSVSPGRRHPGAATGSRPIRGSRHTPTRPKPREDRDSLRSLARPRAGYRVVCDASSNTVTLLVTEGRITGAFDACIFAPRHPARRS